MTAKMARMVRIHSEPAGYEVRMRQRFHRNRKGFKNVMMVEPNRTGNESHLILSNQKDSKRSRQQSFDDVFITSN